jgi:hypothetical protein
MFTKLRICEKASDIWKKLFLFQLEQNHWLVHCPFPHTCVSAYVKAFAVYYAQQYLLWIYTIVFAASLHLVHGPLLSIPKVLYDCKHLYTS